jgi:hypothetical protein
MKNVIIALLSAIVLHSLFPVNAYSKAVFVPPYDEPAPIATRSSGSR